MHGFSKASTPYHVTLYHVTLFRAAYCSGIFAARTTFVHFAVSDLR